MQIKFYKSACLAMILFLLAGSVSAQKVKEPDMGKPEWEKPFAPFRVAGNLYYVGTYDLAVYLITTDKGSILINTGLASSEKQIKKNIEALGFKYSDIKILLTTQAHFDHMGAMAAIKKKTGALFMADAAEKEVLETGGDADYALGGHGAYYEPVTADRWLHNGDTISLGDMHLVLLHHPGHTKGSCSYLFTVKDDSRSYRVLIANMPTIVAERRFKDISDYPTVVQDYANTFKAMKSLQFDIWVSSHASQFDLHNKYKPGDAYNPMVFADRAGYDEELNELEKAYEKKMSDE